MVILTIPLLITNVKISLSPLTKHFFSITMGFIVLIPIGQHYAIPTTSIILIIPIDRLMIHNNLYISSMCQNEHLAVSPLLYFNKRTPRLIKHQTYFHIHYLFQVPSKGFHKKHWILNIHVFHRFSYPLVISRRQGYWTWFVYSCFTYQRVIFHSYVNVYQRVLVIFHPKTRTFGLQTMWDNKNSRFSQL